MRFANSSGSALIQVMILSAAVAFVGLGAARMHDMLTKQNRLLDIRTDIQLLSQEVQAVLNSPSNCNEAIRYNGSKITAGTMNRPTVGGNGQRISLVSDQFRGDELKANGRYSRMIQVTDVRLHNVGSETGYFAGQIEVTFDFVPEGTTTPLTGIPIAKAIGRNRVQGSENLIFPKYFFRNSGSLVTECIGPAIKSLEADELEKTCVSLNKDSGGNLYYWSGNTCRVKCSKLTPGNWVWQGNKCVKVSS